MPPSPRPEAHQHKPDPQIKFDISVTPAQAAHIWMAIANYQAYRYVDPTEGIDMLPDDHPLVVLMNLIGDRVPELIQTGIVNGWDVRPLMVIQQAMEQAATGSMENGMMPGSIDTKDLSG